MFRLLLNFLILCFFTCLFSACNERAKYSTDPKIIAEGEVTFKTYCAACHDINTDGIGPKLNGVTKIADYKWLSDFIKNPKQMIDSEDERAKKLYEKYAAYMPEFSFLKEEQLDAVLSYIDSQSNEISESSESEVDAVVLPKTDPVIKSNIALILEDYLTIPSSSEFPPLARISNMRVRPGSPNGELYINDQRGYIYLVKGQVIKEFFNIRQHIQKLIESPGIGTGFGSFDFHPDFDTNKLIYTTHAEEYTGIPGKNTFNDSIKIAMQWILSEWKLTEPTPNKFQWTQREILRVNFPTHFHGFQDLRFVPDIPKDHPDYGLLYLGIGEGGAVVKKLTDLLLNIESPLGTIIRIDPGGTDSYNGQYGIPLSNPFSSSSEKEVWKEIWAYGFRNPHRLEWTTQGDMLVADIGQHSLEELNLVKPGKNYGWYKREGNHQIDPSYILSAFPTDNYGEQYELPLAQYDHYDGSAVIGGYEYSGSISQLKGKYIFGDIGSGKIFYIPVPFEKDALNTIYGLQIMYNDSITTMQKIVGNDRVDLRFGKDQNQNLYIISRTNGKIWLVKGVE